MVTKKQKQDIMSEATKMPDGTGLEVMREITTKTNVMNEMRDPSAVPQTKEAKKADGEAWAGIRAMLAEKQRKLDEKDDDKENRTASAPSKKRKSDQMTAAEFDPDSIHVPEEDGFNPTISCNGIRSKIRALLDAKEVTQTRLAEQLGVSTNSLRTFMNAQGAWKGDQSDTYPAAYIYFKKREAAGLKKPSNRSSGAKKAKTDKSDVPDVSDIKLDKEDKDKVEVYDTCDEVRRKITQHLQHTGMSAAALGRELQAMMHTKEGVPTGHHMNEFRKKSGPLDGCVSPAYYAAYVYFEKLRVGKGQAKSKHREEMEARWGKEKGVDTQHQKPRTLLGGPGMSWTIDKWGRIAVTPEHPRGRF